MATFEFQNPSGSAYFVIETITTSSTYPVGTPKYMEGTWDVNGVISYASAFCRYDPSFRELCFKWGQAQFQ